MDWGPATAPLGMQAKLAIGSAPWAIGQYPDPYSGCRRQRRWRVLGNIKTVRPAPT